MSRSNSLKHQYGSPLNLLTFEQDIDETKMVVHNENLDKIFLHPEVAHRSIFIVSIIGAYREGKSFFLDYCLRFLYANYKSVNYMSNPINDAANWMGGSENPLTGFSWKNGSSRDTSGIVLWSDVFLATMKDGEKVAIILMDTQGLFDKETTPADNSRIFSLATLMSSVQIFNIMGFIEEDQLQYLQLAVDLSKLADKDNQVSIETKPFQKLLFLIRDWSYPDEYSFGLEGGNKYIQEQLEIKENQNESLKSVREYIFSSFEEISCCLLPEPGRSVKKTGYDGRWSKMESDFKHELKILIERTLHPNKLVIKKLNNQSLVGAEIKKYYEIYLEAFKLKKNVCAQPIYEIHLQQQMKDLIENVSKNYKEQLKRIPFDDMEDFEKRIYGVHCDIKKNMIDEFLRAIQMRTGEQKLHFKNILESKLEEILIDQKIILSLIIEKTEKEGKLQKFREKEIDFIIEKEGKLQKFKEKEKDAIQSDAYDKRNTALATVCTVSGTICLGAIVGVLAAPATAVIGGVALTTIIGASFPTLSIANFIGYKITNYYIEKSEKKN